MSIYIILHIILLLWYNGSFIVYFQERIYSVIEQNTKSHGKVVQKRNKGNDLRFQLVPNRDRSTRSPESEDPNKRYGDGPL